MHNPAYGFACRADRRAAAPTCRRRSRWDDDKQRMSFNCTGWIEPRYSFFVNSSTRSCRMISPPALDGAVRMPHVAVRREQQLIVIGVHLAPQRTETRSEQADVALLAGCAAVRPSLLRLGTARPHRRWRRRRAAGFRRRERGAPAGFRCPRARRRRASRRAPGPSRASRRVGSPRTPDFETTPGPPSFRVRTPVPVGVLAHGARHVHGRRDRRTASSTSRLRRRAPTSDRRLPHAHGRPLQPVTRIGVAEEDAGVGERLRGVGQRHQRAPARCSARRSGAARASRGRGRRRRSSDCARSPA